MSCISFLTFFTFPGHARSTGDSIQVALTFFHNQLMIFLEEGGFLKHSRSCPCRGAVRSEKSWRVGPCHINAEMDRISLQCETDLESNLTLEGIIDISYMELFHCCQMGKTNLAPSTK